MQGTIPLQLPADAKSAALHPGGPDCHCLSSFAPDLQWVIAAWDELPSPIRTVVVTLLEYRNEGEIVFSLRACLAQSAV